MDAGTIRDRELELLRSAGLDVAAASVIRKDGATFFLVRRGGGERLLAVRGEIAGFSGARHEPTDTLLCPLDAKNAETLRQRLPWLRPVPLGLATSFGFGDRLGLATPGHVRAVRAACGGEAVIAPIFAQQSVRENLRTGRNPQEVMDDALWGLLAEGWRSAWGADADHLKRPEDVEAFAAAGFSFFTIDPGDVVVDAAPAMTGGELDAALRGLPWEALEDSAADLERRYADRVFDLDTGPEHVDPQALRRAAVKYGRAVAHTATMYRHIRSRVGEGAFELEVSVDETASPTTVGEHLYVASELRRLGVRWVSLAPRFVGAFEKGVDYIGDPSAFEREFSRHAAVARLLGPYKLSLHSGSDKFSIYPIAARLAAGTDGPLVHVKTAGTSYLEGLRTAARVDGPLFRDILGLARERYESDRATYHVSARLEQVPAPEDVDDLRLADLLDDFHTREVLHVTFGSVLDALGGRLGRALRRHDEAYARALQAHFERHLEPFVHRAGEPQRAAAATNHMGE